MEEKEETMKTEVLEQVVEAINNITEKGLEPSNLDNLGKLIDIHKDLRNEQYWEEKEEYYMRLRGYDNDRYGRGRSRDSRGRYRGEEEYGRRGVPGSGRGRYRGHDYIDEMYDNYGNYAEANEDHRRGNYGAKDDMLQSIDDTMGAVYDLVCVISEDATPEVMNIIRKHIKKMGEI